MKIIDTNIKDLKIIKHFSFKDKRGFLRVTHNNKVLNKKFIFEYATTSYKHSLRGFHFQTKFQQSKYVTVLKGKIIDCVIDLRRKSKTFGKVYKIVLSSKNNLSTVKNEYYVYENISSCLLGGIKKLELGLAVWPARAII